MCRRDAAVVGMTGMALGDIYFHFTWQAWYLVISTSFLVWQVWHLWYWVRSGGGVAPGRRGY